jgi:predicted deacylase
VPPLRIGDTLVQPGSTGRVDLPVARLPTQTHLSLPVAIIHGARPGPTLWLSAALHGDEIGGVEIIRRVLSRVSAPRLDGSLIAVPIVNVFGFISQSRYLPDRRDLNRSFPGSARGSLAARLAHLFMTEVVKQCTHGIDLHTGSSHRRNLPQIRADLDDPDTRRIATAFGATVMIHSRVRDGSLREAATLAHSTGCVEPWRHPERKIDSPHVASTWTRQLAERGNAGASLSLSDPHQPCAHESPIVAVERRHVRDGAKGHQVQPITQF